MDPYEAEEFFKWSEPQRSHLLFVRLKHLEQEVADLKMILNTEGRGRSPGSPNWARPMAVDPENAQGRMCARPSPHQAARRAAMPFSLGTNSLERDLQRQPAPPANYNMRPAANDRPLYLQKLRQVDNMCKEEMARMTAARKNLEPLNQMACDWKLEGAEDGPGADMDGLLEGRLVRDRERSFTEEYLSALASSSKMSNLDASKLNRQMYNSSKFRDFKRDEYKQLKMSNDVETHQHVEDVEFGHEELEEALYNSSKLKGFKRDEYKP